MPLEADLQAIRHGSSNEALEAVQRLGANASFNVHFGQFLEQDGLMRDVLRIFESPCLPREDRDAVHGAMMYLVLAQPRLAAELVALCADPDMRIAVAALDCTKRLFLDSGSRSTQHMLEAGAAPAIVAALKHPNAYLRAAAAAVVIVKNFIDFSSGDTIEAQSVNTCALKALREAGLVPALMDIIREGRSGNVHDSHTTGVFSNIKMEVQLPDSSIMHPCCEPAQNACYSLAVLTGSVRTVDSPLHVFGVELGVEMVKTRQVAAALVDCLRQFDEDPVVSTGKVIKNLLAVARLDEFHQGGLLQPAHRKAFCKELLKAGLPDLLLSLIRPEQPYKSALMLCILLETFWALGDNCLPSGCLGALAAALVKFIEEGPRDGQHDIRNAFATSCLEKVSLGLRKNALPPVQLSPLCIKYIAGVALTAGESEQALAACTLVSERALGDETSTVLKAAMAGGFVPGILRVAREGQRSIDTEFPHRLVVDSFVLIVQSGEERYILQAVKSGILPLLQFYIGMPQYQKPALSVCAKLLEYPWAPAKLREAGFVSSATRAAHSVVELGRWVCTTCPGSGLVADFVDAGLLEKLEKAKSRMKRQPAKQRDVATLIDELSRLRGLGSVDSPEAGSDPAKELCLVKAKDKRVVTSSTSTASGSKRPDPKKDRPASKKGGEQAGACIQCGKSPVDGVKLFLCSRCESVMYCGQECQRSHWRLHKAECSALRAEP